MTTVRNLICTIACVALTFSVVGCAKPKPKAPPPKPVAKPTPPPPKPAPKPKPKMVKMVKITKDHLEFKGHINFAHNSDKILDNSNELLNKIVEVLNKHPEITKVHVIGHTDAKGSAKLNLKLSKRRAASVEKYLREHKVKQTIDSKGAGKGEPLCKEDTDDCHARNRRVEFKIEKKN